MFSATVQLVTLVVLLDSLKMAVPGKFPRFRLPAKVVLIIDTGPPWLYTAAQISAMFSHIELLANVTVPVPTLTRADPPAVVWLLERMRLLRVSPPLFRMA